MFFMLYWERPEERDRAAEDQAYTDKMHQTHGVFTFNTLLVPFSVLFWFFFGHFLYSFGSSSSSSSFFSLFKYPACSESEVFPYVQRNLEDK